MQAKQQSIKKYHDFITFLSVIINCLQANHFFSILHEMKLGYNNTNQELPANFFLVRKFFSLPTNPEKSQKVTGNDNIILSRLIRDHNHSVTNSHLTSGTPVLAWCPLQESWTEDKLLYRTPRRDSWPGLLKKIEIHYKKGGGGVCPNFAVFIKFILLGLWSNIQLAQIHLRSVCKVQCYIQKKGGQDGLYMCSF